MCRKGVDGVNKSELLHSLDAYLSDRGLTYDDSINDLIEALTEDITKEGYL